jgi:hypothetical protein
VKRVGALFGFHTAVWRLSWQTSILQHLFNLITAAAFAFLPIVRALANYRKLVVWQDSGEANDWLVLQMLLAWENGTFFECFPYVRPEPVLVKC